MRTPNGLIPTNVHIEPIVSREMRFTDSIDDDDDDDDERVG